MSRGLYPTNDTDLDKRYHGLSFRKCHADPLYRYADDSIAVFLKNDFNAIDGSFA